MVESVDTPDLKSVEHYARGSSSLPTRTKYLERGIMKNTFEVSSSLVWYNDERMVVKMYFLNDIPFTFDELPVGHLWDQDLVKEANANRSFEVEDVYKGSNYLIQEQCHPCFDNIEISNPEILPEDLVSYFDEEDLRG